jgi:hypothetical protein
LSCCRHFSRIDRFSGSGKHLVWQMSPTGCQNQLRARVGHPPTFESPQTPKPARLNRCGLFAWVVWWGVIHHSTGADQGTQYTSIAFGQRCREACVRPSMGAVGDCYDHAMCKSFFATLECELIDRRRFRNQAEARMEIFQFIEGWCNPYRRHSAIEYQSPIKYERRYQGGITTQAFNCPLKRVKLTSCGRRGRFCVCASLFRDRYLI